MDKLLFLDMYGLEPKLFFNKQEKYRSFLGLFTTFVTVCVTGTFAFMFGTDFFYRANPIVISQEEILEKSPGYYPTSESFPMFFSVLIGNDPLRDIDDFPVSFYFHYSLLKRDSEGKLNFIHDVTIKPKKCSETSSKNNPLMKNYNLDGTFCLDWEELGEIIGEPPRIGGVFEEKEFAVYRIMIDNCEVDYPKYKCKSYLNFEEASKSISEEEITVTAYYPSFYLDINSLNNPIITSFESKPYNLAASVYTIERRTFEMSTFDDDTGWIFKDIQTYEAMRQNKIEVETQVNFRDSKKKRFFFYALFNYLGRRTTIIRRRFMKIQELIAMVGGFLKLITLVSQGIVKFLAGFKMNLILVEKTNAKFFRKREPIKDTYISKTVFSLTTNKIKPMNLTLVQYLMNYFRFSSNKEVEKYNAIVEQLRNKLDIIALIELQEKISIFEANQANKGRDTL